MAWTRLLLLAAGLQQALGVQLNVSSPDSIRNASTNLAYQLMSYYKNNATGIDPTLIGTMPAPVYWWEGGAVWGAMIDYWAYTNDSSYVNTTTQALLAQVGADQNYQPAAYTASLGNDDQAFWALAVLSAMEYGYPNGPSGSPTWQDLAEAVFNAQAARWDLTSCNGGLKWQIFTFNAGYNYKNSVSNGGLFQIAARLARYTGNSTYVEWAEKVWDWTTAVGLISDQYQVFDGTDDLLNCSQLNHVQWSYGSGMFLYGAAIMYNYTNGSSLWEKRTTGLLNRTNATFFYSSKNASNVMYEVACEPSNTCNYDQLSFKAYLARWLAKTTAVAPYTASIIDPLLSDSAQAAAEACSGGDGATTCGNKWYVGGYDGSFGTGQQLAGLEVTQALLIGDAPDLQTQSNVKIAKVAPSGTSSMSSSTATSSQAAATSQGAAANSRAGHNPLRGAVAAVKAVVRNFA